MSSQEQQSPSKALPPAYQYPTADEHARGGTGTPAVTKRLGTTQQTEEEDLRLVLMQTMVVAYVCMQLIETPEKVTDVTRAMLMSIE